MNRTLAGWTLGVVSASLLASGLTSGAQAQGSDSPLRDSLASFIHAPNSPVPAGTQLKSVSMLPGGTAVVNFSHEFRDNFHGSDTQELRVLNGIFRAAAPFSNVKKVWILVDGQRFESLGGMVLLTDPIPVTR